MRYESLHNHTNYSDGSQSHLELLKDAERLGYGFIAITDHDLMPDTKALKALQGYTGKLKWTVGIELSSTLPIELAGDDAVHLHILGLFINANDKALNEHCQAMAIGRVERMRRYLKHFHTLGFKVTEADCFKASGTGFIGSPHMVKAILSYPANRRIVKQMFNKMAAEAKTNKDVKTAFETMVKAGPHQHPYVLFMQRTSYFAMPKGGAAAATFDLDKSVALIRNAGGAALMAHWYLDKTKLSQADLVKLVKTKRLDGVDIGIPKMGAVDYSKDFTFLTKLVKQTDSLLTYGADAHAASDLESFAKSSSGPKSVGSTARLIEQLKPNLKWSNFNA